ncbi:MAG: lamin tail domain-containing protein, partial [Planctomycetota bacterium]
RSFRYREAPDVRFVEIHYHPKNEGDEFLEIRNFESRPVDLSSWSVTGVGYRFPSNTTLAPNSTIVLAKDPQALRKKHPTLKVDRVFGPYKSFLSNSGETIRLLDNGVSADGRRDHPETINVVRYTDRAPWPTEADGQGPSLELDGFSKENRGEWRASKGVGAPGR